jgi:hypothetical protein
LSSTDQKEVRKFGSVAFLFFGGLCALGLFLGKPIPACFFGALSSLGLGFILFPAGLRPVYSGWLKISHFVGKIITVVMLTLAYYLVITPSGMIKALIGGRPISLKFDRKIPSYWVDRTEPAQPKERFLKRY